MTYGSATTAAISAQVERNDEEPFPDSDLLLALRDALQPEADPGGEEAGQQKRPDRLRVSERESDREEEGQREVLDQRSDEVERGADVDADAHTTRGRHARQYALVRSAATGTISSRPIHMSTIMIPFETSLNGANEPIGPAKPKRGPDVPERAGRGGERLERRQLEAHAVRVEQEQDRPDDEDADVEEDEGDHRADHALVDREAVQPDGRDVLGMDGLVELTPQDPADHEMARDLHRAARRARGRAGEHERHEQHRRGRRHRLPDGCSRC